jgi:hypothetical protein
MRKTVVVWVLCAAMVAAGAARLPAQVKITGYLSGEYNKGQAASDFALGSFGNVQGGVIATGAFAQKFRFTVEARALTLEAPGTSGEARFDVEQAWVGFVPSQAFGVKAGLFLVPFGAWNQASRPYETVLIGTPLNLQYLYPQSWRDLGLVVDGQIGILAYAAYIGNGLKEADSLAQGQQFADNNKDKAKGGRLALVFSQGIQAGVSYYTGKFDDLDQRSLTLKGAHLSWVTSEWEVRAEATKGKIENPQPFGNGKCEGYSVWAIMNFRYIQPVGSFQKVKYEDLFHGEGIALDVSRWTAGVRVALGTNLFLKGEYQWNLETPKVKNNLIRVQAGASF